MRKFYACLTSAGEQKIAAAAISGVPVNFSEMAVGDGGGVLPAPLATQDGLVNEVYRAPLNRLSIADQGANIISAQMIMPPQTGGYWLREAALYDDEGVCLAVANLPESYKPQLSQGSGRTHSVNLWVAVSNAASVELKADSSVIMASVAEVDSAKAEAKDYADKLAGMLQDAIRDAVTQAKTDAWEADNPVGTVRFFNQNINPNTKWPQSKWQYTGENKTIRVGAASGSDVGRTGGSDTVTLSQSNLPAVKIGVTGTAQNTDLGTKQTSQAGAFSPVSDARFNKLTANSADIDGTNNTGDVDSDNATSEYRVSGMTSDLWSAATIRDIPNHIHNVVLGQHGHNVTGQTDNLGQGQALSVVESHIRLMCWARVA